MTDPFHDIAEALAAATDPSPGAAVRFDPSRAKRTGIPEFIYGACKSEEDLLTAIRASLDARGRALATRVAQSVARNIMDSFANDIVDYNHTSHVLLVVQPGSQVATTGGRIGVIAAGTSDRRVAGEAVAIAYEMGCEVREVTDVGVAGLHRLVAPLRDLMAWEPDALIVAAGMDGALPSVVAGLVDVPVIGLPVSSGYGMGGDGTAALMTMLQSCAPGLAVVNIDNALGAATTASLIANRAAKARNNERPPS